MKHTIIYTFILFSFLACQKGDYYDPVTPSQETVKVKSAAEESGKKKLKVAILGDSISTFNGIIPSGHQYYYPTGDVTDWKKTYWGVLLTEYWDAELDVNCSFSGGCVAPTPAKAEITNFLYRCKMFKDPDIILIHGGTNDGRTNQKVSIGDFDFVSSLQDLDTESRFRDSYIAMIRTIRNDHPDAQIIILIGDYVGGDYGESVEKIAQFFDIPYVDFRPHKGLITMHSGCHPDAKGFAYMASVIYESTREIVDALK